MKDKRHQRLDRYEHQHSSKEKIGMIGDGFSALLAWRTALKNYKTTNNNLTQRHNTNYVYHTSELLN